MSEDFVENSCLIRLICQTSGDKACTVSEHVYTKERREKARKLEAYWKHLFRSNQRFTSNKAGGVAA